LIYLDNAASTAVHEKVIQEMLPFFIKHYGNPSSIHRLGRTSHKSIQIARKKIDDLINAEVNEILLTSGGTESNNTALNIVKKTDKKHIITSSIEHEAILEPCKKLEKNGYNVTYIPVDKYGLVKPNDIESSISNETCLVSIMFANNEVGTIQPIKEITKICNEKKIPFHTDAIQAIGKTCIDVKDLGIDMLSLSSHKINGPKGVGALYIKKGININP